MKLQPKLMLLFIVFIVTLSAVIYAIMAVPVLREQPKSSTSLPKLIAPDGRGNYLAGTLSLLETNGHTFAIFVTYHGVAMVEIQNTHTNK